MTRMFRSVSAVAILLLAASGGYAEISSTHASVRSNNSLIVDIQVTTGGNAAKVAVTYQAEGVDPARFPLQPRSPPLARPRLRLEGSVKPDVYLYRARHR